MTSGGASTDQILSVSNFMIIAFHLTSDTKILCDLHVIPPTYSVGSNFPVVNVLHAFDWDEIKGS